MLCCTRKPVNISILPLSIATGKCTMISRDGVLSILHRFSSRFSLRAANSNRALWASQGLISWSKVIVGVAIAIPFSISIACRLTEEHGEPLTHKSQKRQVFLRLCGEFQAGRALNCPRPAGSACGAFHASPNPSESRPANRPRQACRMALSGHSEPAWEPPSRRAYATPIGRFLQDSAQNRHGPAQAAPKW